jgi:hypothetical protein
MSRTFRRVPTDKHRERRPEGRFADHFDLPTERPAPVRRARVTALPAAAVHDVDAFDAEGFHVPQA